MIFPNIFSFFYFFKGIKYLQWALSDVKIERVSRLLSWKPCQGTFLYFRKSFWLKGLDGGFQFHQKRCCLDIAGAISRETGSWRQLCPQGPSQVRELQPSGLRPGGTDAPALHVAELDQVNLSHGKWWRESSHLSLFFRNTSSAYSHCVINGIILASYTTLNKPPKTLKFSRITLQVVTQGFLGGSDS